MLSRNTKALFYRVAGPLMKINGLIYRYFRFSKKDFVKVHLGPGQERYIDGWLNIDANIFTGKADVWADLRNPLPFPDNSVDAIYSHHVIEHLPDLDYHFKEVSRVLKPEGLYRVAGPNGDSAIKKFIENDKKWFSDFPVKRNSIGGRFENLIFCKQEHLTILTFSFLEEIMTKVGFINLNLCKPVKETNFPEIFNDCLAKEHEPDFQTPRTLVIEGVNTK